MPIVHSAQIPFAKIKPSIQKIKDRKQTLGLFVKVF